MAQKEGEKPETEKKTEKKKKVSVFKKILIIAAAVALLVGIRALFGNFYNYILVHMPKSATVSDIAKIKEAVTEIDVAKQEGDNLGKTPTNASLQQAENDATFGQQIVATNFSSGTFPFAIAVHNWGAQVQSNSSKNNWDKVADAPDASTIKLSAKDASDTYDEVLDNIDRYQIFGDYAISQNNKDAMKWIGARLHSEEIYLDALSNANIAEGPHDTALAATTFGATCYYGRGHIMVFSNRKNKADCIKKLNEGIKPLRTAAQNYYKTGNADAAKDWQVAWGKLKDEGYPISTTGATVGNNDIKPPAMVAFQDACKAKNGTTPSGGVKDRMPTTESGQTCTFKGPKGGTCWDFLTDSGLPFSGGDGDCPQVNLLAKAIQQITPIPEITAAPSYHTNPPSNSTPIPDYTSAPAPVPEKTTNAYPFDGSYSTTPSVSCSTADSSTSLNSDIRNFMSSFTVQQGKIYYSGWYTNVANPPSNPTIASDGSVSTSYTDADAGATEHTEYSARFTDSGTVSGNLNGYWMFGSGPQTTCSGSFSGSRNQID
ncbi:MAG: hypothetical protein NTZ65_04710 [Candidatus Berkelbacteria bacterium]|nr:hypothetical protein [Candidatus Berkelbacteria bacterium]